MTVRDEDPESIHTSSVSFDLATGSGPHQPDGFSPALCDLNNRLAFALSALVAASFASTKAMAEVLGENSFLTLSHQGKSEHIHIALVGGRALLVIVFDDRTMSEAITKALLRLFGGMLDQGITLLQKPFTLPALKEKVRAVLDSAPLPQEAVMSSRAVPQPPAPGTREKLSTFRAQRFNLHLPLRYRPVGEQSWRKGTTENISRSGLLFRAEEALQPNVQLEINLVLPAEIAGLAATEVVCRGEVVRSTASAGAGIHPSLAAKILQYHFQHGTHTPQA